MIGRHHFVKIKGIKELALSVFPPTHHAPLPPIPVSNHGITVRESSQREFCNTFPRVWTAPSWQELFSRLQHWSVRPCVRPLDAVHTTAGHNALRGSGPGQKPAFDNAWRQLGCPDRR